MSNGSVRNIGADLLIGESLPMLKWEPFLWVWLEARIEFAQKLTALLARWRCEVGQIDKFEFSKPSPDLNEENFLPQM